MYHPLMPTLYDDPVVNIAYDIWDRYHIWLHKQPLFLWQIALSFRLFGVNEFALRLPSIVLGTILVLIAYRTGKLLVNQRVGYISGMLIISTIYILELIGGRQALDHNDFAFLVYISLSIWSFIEYHYTRKKRWIYLVGLFSGLAVLCKWLVGLLVYFGWFIFRILQSKIRISENKDFFLSLLVTLIIAVPWQILTFVWYPTEAANAYHFNALHFTVALDGHDGSFWYHFNMVNTIYGAIASFLIIPSFWVLYKRCNDKKLFFSLLSMVLVTFLFFSMAATKMPSFTIVLAMTVSIAFASLLDHLLGLLEKQINVRWVNSLVFCASVLLIVLLRFDVEYLQEKYTMWKEDNHYTRRLSHNREVFKSLDLPENTVLFNVKGRHYIEAMFYTGLPAYNIIPSLEQYQDMKIKGRTIGVFKPVNMAIPDFLKNDSTVIIIDKEIQGYN